MVGSVSHFWDLDVFSTKPGIFYQTSCSTSTGHGKSPSPFSQLDPDYSQRFTGYLRRSFKRKITPCSVFIVARAISSPLVRVKKEEEFPSIVDSGSHALT
jgi:hypothetical protein